MHILIDEIIILRLGEFKTLVACKINYITK